MNVFKLEFKNQLRSVITWGLSVSLVLALIMLLFPSMQNDAMKAITAAKMESLPPEVLLLFGVSEIGDLTQISNFFAIMQQYVNLVVCIFGGMLGAGALIREETDGTIEFLYAQPVGRFRLAVEKMLADFCGFTLIPLLLWCVCAAMFGFLNDGAVDYATLLAGLTRVCLGLWLAGTTFLALGFLASSLLKSASRASAFGLAVVFITFIAGILSQMVKGLDFLLYLSPLDTVKPNILMKSGPDGTGLAVCFGVLAVSVAFCLLIYRRKDLRT